MTDPAPLPYGEGTFRRRFLLRGGAQRVVADMEDDFHRFRVTLEHDGERVVAMRGEARRYPWTECPGASEPLRALEGLPLTTDPAAAARFTEPRRNCTHLFDVASLAVSHAAAGRTRRLYDIEIPDARKGATVATLRRDGAVLLAWTIEKGAIADPPPFTGVKLRGAGFVAWVAEHLDDETGEAALALRRALFISMGRAHDLDAAPTAEAYLALARGSCHSFTPGIAERARRMRGTTRDFTHCPERLLADLEA